MVLRYTVDLVIFASFNFREFREKENIREFKNLEKSIIIIIALQKT